MIILCNFWSSSVSVDEECSEVTSSRFLETPGDNITSFLRCLHGRSPCSQFGIRQTMSNPIKSYFVPVSMEAFSRWSYMYYCRGKSTWCLTNVDDEFNTLGSTCPTLPCTCRWWGPPQRLGTAKQAIGIFDKIDRERRNCLNVVTWRKGCRQIPRFLILYASISVVLDEVDFAVPKCIWIILNQIHYINCSTCSKCNNGGYT